jgi:D-2-hydroxyacid dehydrogenase (NADP+)
MFLPDHAACDKPLWTMPNVIITPNIGGRSDRFVEQTLTALEPDLAAYKEAG